MKSIEQLRRKDLNCNIFSVYDYDGLTITELLCQFFTKINECIDTSNETIDLAKWLVNEGLELEVVKKLMMWLEDGTLENIINVNLFNTLNDKINALNSQLGHKADKEEMKKITGLEFLSMNGKDIYELLQYYIDNNMKINLPSNYRFICSKPIIVRKSTVIYGNNSYIKFTYNGERGLFEQNENGAFLECHDLEVEIENDQIAYDFRLSNSNTGTHIRLYNCVIRGNKNNTRGVLMTQNDFSCIRDTKFWYVSHPIKAITTQRDNTQIVFDNVGIVECETGVELEQNDKVTLHNVDISFCNIGFKVLGRNKRLKFLNCHVEHFKDTGYMIIDNVDNDDIIFENCSILLDTETSKQGFYFGSNSQYKTTGLKLINCMGKLSNTKVFNIKCPVILHGEIHKKDSFVSHGDSYVNTKIIRDNEEIVYKEKVYTPNASSFSGTVSYTQNNNFNNFNFNGEIYIVHNFDEPGYYEITYNGFNAGNNDIFLNLQKNGGDWSQAFSYVRLNKEKISQRVVVNIPEPHQYRIIFKSFDSTDLKLRDIRIKNIKLK